MKRFHLVVIVLSLGLAGGCGGKGGDGPQGDAGPETVADGTGDGTGDGDLTRQDGMEAAGCKKGGAVVCCPGETNGCGGPDGRSLLTCNADRTGWDLVECVDDQGEPTTCVASVENPGGMCATCLPGVRKCKDDDVILQCNQFGNGWEETQDCNGATTGQICLQGTCVALCEVNQKLNMYMGCDFWGADLDNAFVPGGPSGFLDAAGAQYAIVVSNPHPKWPADVHVFTNEGEVLYDSKDAPLPSGPLPPGELRIFNLPRRDLDGTLLAPLAYRVQSSIPITAYQFNPLENVDVFSNDASLLLPSNVLGKYYFAMTREQSFTEARGYITVIAVRPGETEVSVQVTAPTLAGVDAHTGAPIKHMEPGDTVNFTLVQFDTLNIETDEVGSDLTGSIVLANRDVAVIGGSEGANAPNTNHCDKVKKVCEWDGKTSCQGNGDCSDFITCCADHIEHQLWPVKSWGLQYVASKLYPRNQEKDVYRIIAAEDNTQVTMIPPQTNIPVLNRGEWVDFESVQNFEIIGKKPIMVGQFMAAQDAPDPNVNGVPQIGDAATGDPAFLLLVPNEQFRQDYVFLAPNKYAFDYVTIVAPAAAKVWYVPPKPDPVPADYCLEVDPARIRESCAPLGEDQFKLIGTGKYKTAKFLVADGVSRLHADQPVGVYVYGYDQYVSYGYAGGLDIKDLGLIKEPGEQ
jgi:hypothetical protein